MVMARCRRCDPPTPITAHGTSVRAVKAGGWLHLVEPAPAHVPEPILDTTAKRPRRKAA